MFKGGGPFKMPAAGGPSEEETRRKEGLKNVKQLVESYIPPDHLKNRDCVVDVQEAQCGDPNCAPIDTVVRIIYRGNCGTVFGMPCEAHEVGPEDVEESMPPDEFFAKWHAGEKAQWPPEPENPEPGEPPEVELRFPVGTRVECCISKGPDGWVPGEVVMHWYRAASWPTGQFAPYQIKLEESGNLIFAPQDRDNCIRKAP